VITQQGKLVALLMDIEKYPETERALKEFSDPDYLVALLEARQEIREGRGIPAEEVFAKKGLCNVSGYLLPQFAPGVSPPGYFSFLLFQSLHSQGRCSNNSSTLL